LKSLKTTALLVANTKDGEVVMRVVLLFEVFEFLILELLASVRINLDRCLSLALRNFTNGDCALFGFDSLLLESLEVGSNIECPEAVNENHQGDD
jgi:hypothetical protein